MASGVPSNFATIPVALSGRVCSDDPVLAPVTPEELQNLASLASVNVGSISLTNVAPVLEAPGPPPPPGLPPPRGRVYPRIHVGMSATSANFAYATFQKYTAGNSHPPVFCNRRQWVAAL